MVVVYLGSLATLLVNSFYSLDDFTGLIVRQFTLKSYAQLFTPSNLDIVLRTVGMAAAVTLADAVLAFPLAYFIARYASPRSKGWLYLAVLLPLWSSYLVRVYAWKLILAKEGILTWAIAQTVLTQALQFLLNLPAIGEHHCRFRPSESSSSSPMSGCHTWSYRSRLPWSVSQNHCLKPQATLGRGLARRFAMSPYRWLSQAL
jgi:ABC-type sugar transport system permease subunit